MKQQSISAAVDRLEAIAGDFLEKEIANVEHALHVNVKEVDVALIPDPDGDGPAVQVTVTTQQFMPRLGRSETLR